MVLSKLGLLGFTGALGVALACSSGQGPSGSFTGTDTSRDSGGSSSGGTAELSSGGIPYSSGGGDSGAGGVDTAGAAAGGASGGANGVGGRLPFDLAMNDVTILAPLPERIAQPVLLRGWDAANDGTPLVPRALFDRISVDGSMGSVLFPEAYERLQLVAVRFDLCDHNAPGPCPSFGDASLRLVFQPLSDTLGAEDVGFHAFYAIAETEIPAALQTLGELSALRTGPGAPLAPSATLASGNIEYGEKLRAFVRAYGGESRLVRLTMNAQPALFASITWLFRGVERRDGEFEDLRITDTLETTQQVTLFGEGFFDMNPITDAPQGLARAIDMIQFENATEEEQRVALEALVAIDNPLMNGPDTVACVACHTSTVALATRAQDRGIDPLSLQGRYTTSFDVTIGQGMSATTDRTLRALGWIGTTPLISQRVANDTALLLEDIARRFE